MEQDREVDQILMNVRGATGSVISASLISARASLKLMIFLMRMVKKGLVAAGFSDNFKQFSRDTEGKYTVYNIPLKEGQAEKLKQINKLELKLEGTKNPLEKAKLRNAIKELQTELPELEQLKKLGISHCVLPKLNGSDQTIQVAVAKTDDQMFKNWFLNHLTTGLSGGEMGMEEIKVFTEGNYTIFNLPFEGEGFKAALPDFDVLGINYAILPDLKVGDGNSQISVPNADRGKLETWFTMWRDKQLREGKEVGEMYAMDQESYMATSQSEDDEYVASADSKYQEANTEFEEQSKKVPWNSPMQKENSEEYARFLQDKNYEKITINQETLLENMAVSQKAAEMSRSGYFISRIPGTYNWIDEEGKEKKDQLTLILPRDKVFKTDEGRTYVAFLPKNEKTMVGDEAGNIHDYAFKDVHSFYDKVERNLKKVESLKKGIPLKKEPVKKDMPLKKEAAKDTSFKNAGEMKPGIPLKKETAARKAPVPKIPK